MRMLFEMDMQNYDSKARTVVRPSVRGVIIRGGRIAMVHSLKYDYYKFPGGGIEYGETHDDTLIREVREEAGLTVLPESIREYGWVHRIQRGKCNTVFVQDNYYYLCRTKREVLPQRLDAYEAEERFTMAFIDPHLAITVNREQPHGPKDQIMLEREARVLEMLLDEGYFSR
jgi:8-oxo-dGTP pyrophosphatase MutT (NUDIX family)